MTALVLVYTQHWHGHLSLDSQPGVQKVHQNPTPRVGGLAIVAGLLASAAVVDTAQEELIVPLILCGVPAFAFGLLEDLTKRVSVRTRLLATMGSTLLAYLLDSSIAITGVNVSPLVATETEIKMVGNLTKFPLSSGSNRFHVIPGDEKIVSYICSGGKLYRNANYAYSPSCPAPSAGTTPILANEATCNFAYSTADIRNGLVQLTLTFSKSGETVSIYHEVHVNNTP